MIDSIIKLTLKTVKPQETLLEDVPQNLQTFFANISTFDTPQNPHTSKTETSTWTTMLGVS